MAGTEDRGLEKAVTLIYVIRLQVYVSLCSKCMVQFNNCVSRVASIWGISDIVESNMDPLLSLNKDILF